MLLCAITEQRSKSSSDLGLWDCGHTEKSELCCSESFLSHQPARAAHQTYIHILWLVTLRHAIDLRSDKEGTVWDWLKCRKWLSHAALHSQPTSGQDQIGRQVSGQSRELRLSASLTGLPAALCQHCSQGDVALTEEPCLNFSQPVCSWGFTSGHFSK